MVRVEAVSLLSSRSSSNGLISFTEPAEEDLFAADLDFGRPLSARAAPANAHFATGVQLVKALVALVLNAAHLAKVAKSIVVSLAVDVVYVLAWPFAMHKRPYHTVRQASHAKQSAFPIAVNTEAMQGGCAWVMTIPTRERSVSRKETSVALLPRQLACGGIV